VVVIARKAIQVKRLNPALERLDVIMVRFKADALLRIPLAEESISATGAPLNAGGLHDWKPSLELG
jgi:hypothetical protein